ncbi:hypothetical protein KSP40_PGU013624 [Platanthera guangdongensis]|uniref:Plastid lipid-associated protein/fibrillin conserved domain-containing protein n=1 Tax=Platanthera guangdongensis TaxID=2320717 RepID=A0ABR2LRV5_9ASPA
MAVGVARLGFPLLTSWRSTPSSSRSRAVYSKSTGRRPRLHSIFASLAEEERGVSFTEPEVDLIDALDVGRAVEALENLKGIADPTNSDLIEGRWQLVFTTRPGTASPIQVDGEAAQVAERKKRALWKKQCGLMDLHTASVDNWKVAAAANSLKGLEIVKKNGNLENHNTLFPGFSWHI